MEQFVILLLVAFVVFLVLKNKQLLDKSHTPTSNQRQPTLKAYEQDEAILQQAMRREEYLKQEAEYRKLRDSELQQRVLKKKLEGEEVARKEAARKEEYLRQQTAYLEVRNKEREEKELHERLKDEEDARKEQTRKEEFLTQQAAYLEARNREKLQNELHRKSDDDKATYQVKKKVLRNEHDQASHHKENINPKGEIAENLPTSDLRRQAKSFPTLNSGIPELDGPGMYQRLTGCGPQGHICYLLFSESHRAYKVGMCKPDRIGIRIKSIRDNVHDTLLVGTAVFTSYQNAFDAEQTILNENRQYRYRGITGSQTGSSEWITRKPPGRRPSFTTPEFVEQRYQQQSDSPLPRLDIPDEYTIYLAYSRAKGAYKAKWCRTSNLSKKIDKLRREAPDTQIISRIKIERHGKAREITKELNTKNGSYSRDGRYDIIEWSSEPTYLETFKGWDVNGNHK